MCAYHSPYNSLTVSRLRARKFASPQTYIILPEVRGGVAQRRRGLLIPSCHDCRMAGGWHLPLFIAGNVVARFSLPLLVAKVAQKPRTTSLAVSRATKPKTNATRVKHLPSLFFHAFVAPASHDRTRRSLPRRRCEVRVCGAPSAQSCLSFHSCFSYNSCSSCKVFGRIAPEELTDPLPLRGLPLT